ncbi:MAG: hypothetical protein AB8H12_08335, partial [Lewinella sp.]
AMMDQLLLTIQDDLQEIIDSLGEEIIVSKTIDLIRLALDTLKVIHEPTIVAERQGFAAQKLTFQQTYKLIPTGTQAPPPPPLPSNMTVVPKTLSNSSGSVPSSSTIPNDQLTNFREEALAIRDTALVLTEHDLYATLTDKIPQTPRTLIKEFGETIRSGSPQDTDIFALVRAMVEGLGEGDDPEDLIEDVMVLVQSKINFLVRN